MKREYDRMCQVSEELPSYIIENLKEMPNNKGYIWRGVWFYGELKPQPGPCVMFEKQREIMYIHEIYPDKHMLFKKMGKNPREFVHQTPRKDRKLPTFFL
jgi:hypothetical protein